MNTPPILPKFGVNSTPIIGQRTQQVQAQVQMLIQQVSLGIYSQLAVNHITHSGEESIRPDKLRKVAKDSLTAARCYFEGVGMIETQDE